MFSVVLKARGHEDNADMGSFLMDLKLVSNLLKSCTACEMTRSELLLRRSWKMEEAEISKFILHGASAALASPLSILQKAHDCLMESITEDLSPKSHPERMFLL